ncbi:MAG: methyltransferase [Candidatus Altiarchaeales archaeon]|nr:methyltransferase [Candidatus Altiarchaeales archaeon]
MDYFLRLSGEHPTLAEAEVAAVLESYQREFSLKAVGDRWFLVSTEADPLFASRPAFTQKAYQVVSFANSLAELTGDLYDVLCDFDSFRIDDAPGGVRNQLGGRLSDLDLKVDLSNPSQRVGVVEVDGFFAAGLRMPVAGGFESRKPQFRPYFHPTSMHPKYARALVNLSRVDASSLLLDPFCGAGGILIEAALMGVESVGWDIDERMVEGCRENLKFLGLEGEVRLADALSPQGEVFDACATDPPYGRSSYTSVETRELYNRFIGNASNFLSQGFLVLVVPDFIDLDSGDFGVEDVFNVRVHKSLTRKIFVLRK